MSRPDQDATVEATPPPPEPEPASKGGKSNAMAARLAATRLQLLDLYRAEPHDFPSQTSS